MHSLVLADNADVAAVLPFAKKAGLGIEFQSFYRPDLLDDPTAALARHRELLVGFTGLRSLHGPFGDLCPGSLDPLVRQVARQRISQALFPARELGVSHIVLHHGYVPNTSSPANWIKRSTDFWRAVLEEVPPEICIHLENMLDTGPDMLLELVQTVGNPRLGICLDAGHAHALSRVPVVDWVKALGHRITYTHLHDNRGSRDEHLPLGQGNLPLRDLLAALNALAPAAIWTVEADTAPSLAWLVENGFYEESGFWLSSCGN